ncbi:hypothetical protein Pcinc_032632 [Petrolisthes cinctipes]|uniref:Uncharacterized protein n=1 Tax=Petrolisthes cinctipes TaxID=88211 RepID=A0AAE1JYW6_PETCI|nr:hypothetical protein Pcinc_032632 [Petrolisthes cinctipes]
MILVRDDGVVVAQQLTEEELVQTQNEIMSRLLKLVERFQQSSDDKIIDTPHSSTSVESTGEHGLGRQLREITSSQSSESDTEDMISLRHSNKIPSTCGKEN